MCPTTPQARIDPISPANLLDPPAKNQAARFAPGFGQRVLLTVDTEEEFDWDADFRRDGYGLDHARWIGKFQQFCEGLGVVPVYLVDWPIANSQVARDIIGSAVRAGQAEVGVQLHPWVNPPHEEDINVQNSFAGNLPVELEREKFCRLRDMVETGFGSVPRIYRAGRYGLGPNTATMLSDNGIAIDSSVRAHFDYSNAHGPNYSHHPAEPYWCSDDRSLLELPLTTVYWGMLRRQGTQLLPLVRQFPKLGGVFSRLGLLERIALTPEGVTIDEAIRGLDMAIDDGLPVIVLSFHSPSLTPGCTPYVRNHEDLDEFYDWFRAVFHYCQNAGVRPTTVEEIMQAVVL
jgi:hypothetical protein